MKLEDMELFVLVAELGSFTKAGDFCNTPKSTVSRRIKDLEDSLKVRLLDRTTRALHLTIQGEAFYQKAKTILEDVAHLRQDVADEQATASGRITVYAPSLMFHIFAHWVTSFRKQYPDIEMELLSWDADEAIGDDRRFDLILQAGELQDSSLIAKKLVDIPGHYYASPGYLAEHGKPDTPQALSDHCVIFRALFHNEKPRWRFESEDGDYWVELNPQIITDSPQGMLSLTLNGAGISRLSDMHAKPFVDQGKLVQVFGDEHRMMAPLYALYPSRRYMPHRVRLLLEFLQEAMPNALEKLLKA